MPITDNMRMQVIATYPNAPIMYNRDILQIHALRLQSNMIEVRSEKRGGGCIPVNKLKIKLRPISSLTDEECIEVALAYGLSLDGFESELAMSKAGMDLALNYDNETCITDTLRRLNIITTVHGIDLVAEGIAILDDKIGEI